MQLHEPPERLELLAAAYALGTLRGPARRRFEAVARERPLVQEAALRWQARLQAMNELQPGESPPPAVWRRIENLIAAEREGIALERQRARATRPPSRGAPWWLLGASGLAVAVLATSLVLVRQSEQSMASRMARAQQEVQRLELALQQAPRVQYVAVLVDSRAEAALLLTVEGPQTALRVQRVGGYREAADRSLQLWALPAEGAPRSLGVLGPGAVAQLPASLQAVGGAPAVAVSLEPLGGVPGEGGPTGPVLFKGALIPKQL